MRYTMNRSTYVVMMNMVHINLLNSGITAVCQANHSMVDTKRFIQV